MRIAVFGAGGVGGYFGGRLAFSGEDVVFIARGEHLQAMRKDGLCVRSVNGDFSLNDINVTDNPKRVGEVDVILLGVKTWQVMDVIDALRPMVGEDTVIVPLQNGVDTPSHLAAVFGKEHVLGGLCRIVSQVESPGCIRHSAIDPMIAFGELDNVKSARVEKLAEAFARAGVKVEIPADIHVAMWQKFIFIAAISGVGSVTRAPIGVVRSLPESRELLQRAISEGIAVARKRGLSLSEEYAQEVLEFIDSTQASATSSMQRDILAGRPSELASQNGAMVRLGMESGVKTPTHAFIYYSLLPLELRARGELEF